MIGTARFVLLMPARPLPDGCKLEVPAYGTDYIHQSGPVERRREVEAYREVEDEPMPRLAGRIRTHLDGSGRTAVEIE